MLYTNLLRTVLLPPGSPEEAAAALATGFEKVAKDPQFMTEYEKIIGAPAELIGREDGKKVIAQLGSIDPKVSAFLKDYVANAH
jgi:tripartite-type tricarboxylate transporter receptor subunit TctC